MANNRCIKSMRQIVLQLKSIQLGYFGPFDTTAGILLAEQRKNLGNYLVNSIRNTWPYEPLHYDPNPIETQINKYMMRLTKEISYGKLKNVSILDLPGFGSTISELDESQRLKIG